MRKSFLSTKTALSLVLSFILPLQMLATELGEAGKRLAALPGVSNVNTTSKRLNPHISLRNMYSSSVSNLTRRTHPKATSTRESFYATADSTALPSS